MNKSLKLLYQLSTLVAVLKVNDMTQHQQTFLSFMTLDSMADLSSSFFPSLCEERTLQYTPITYHKKGYKYVVPAVVSLKGI